MPEGPLAFLPDCLTASLTASTLATATPMPSTTVQASASPMATSGSSALPGGSRPVIFVQATVMTLRATNAPAMPASVVTALLPLSGIAVPSCECRGVRVRPSSIIAGTGRPSRGRPAIGASCDRGSLDGVSQVGGPPGADQPVGPLGRAAGDPDVDGRRQVGPDQQVGGRIGARAAQRPRLRGV